jgi:hypothetical protein
MEVASRDFLGRGSGGLRCGGGGSLRGAAAVQQSDDLGALFFIVMNEKAPMTL